jgi:hypothetical protein
MKYEYYPRDEALLLTGKHPDALYLMNLDSWKVRWDFLPLLCSQRLWSPSESHSGSSRTDGTSDQGVELATYVRGVSRMHMWWIKAIIDT